jgi:hypothetical protein
MYKASHWSTMPDENTITIRAMVGSFTLPNAAVGSFGGAFAPGKPDKKPLDPPAMRFNPTRADAIAVIARLLF